MPRHLAKSWRCISTCPVLAKAIDLHVFKLLKPQWDAAAAPTQYLRDGCSHEVCALALTECIIHGVKVTRSPMFQVYLDKEAAFDSALKEHVVRQLLLASGGAPSQAIAYFAARLASRSTLVSVMGRVLGPICDRRGVE